MFGNGLNTFYVNLKGRMLSLRRHSLPAANSSIHHHPSQHRHCTQLRDAPNSGLAGSSYQEFHTRWGNNEDILAR